MLRFQKYSLIIFAGLLLLLVFPVTVFGLDLGTGLAGKAAKTAGYAPATSTTFAETLGSIVKIALSFVGVIFLSLTFYAGFLWMTAKGNTEQIDSAQNIIRSAIIGLIITVGAYSITNFVVPRIVSKTAGGGDQVLCCIRQYQGGRTEAEEVRSEAMCQAGAVGCNPGVQCSVSTVPRNECR